MCHIFCIYYSCVSLNISGYDWANYVSHVLTFQVGEKHCNLSGGMFVYIQDPYVVFWLFMTLLAKLHMNENETQHVWNDRNSRIQNHSCAHECNKKLQRRLTSLWDPLQFFNQAFQRILCRVDFGHRAVSSEHWGFSGFQSLSLWSLRSKTLSATVHSLAHIQLPRPWNQSAGLRLKVSLELAMFVLRMQINMDRFMVSCTSHVQFTELIAGHVNLLLPCWCP